MTKANVLELKKEMEFRLKQWQATQTMASTCEHQFKESQIEFRIAEVKYVLENLNYLNRMDKLSKQYLDLYLTHCQNCLNGNIDGTVVSIDELAQKSLEERQSGNNE